MTNQNTHIYLLQHIRKAITKIIKVMRFIERHQVNTTQK